MGNGEISIVDAKNASKGDNLLVQKSHPLMDLSRSDLSLAEFKILDLYLAKINSHKPEQRIVTLEKGEIEDALGVKRISASNLAERLIHLGQGIKIPDSTKKSGFHIMWLLEEAKCEQGEDGQWKVTLEASSKAMQYFFNIENLGYFRYKLRCIAGLTSRFSYVLFLYLEENRHMHLTWTVPLDQLRQIMRCDQEESYSKFKVFNDRILKRSQKELSDKTECQFTYVPVKKGRSVVSICFMLEPLNSLSSELNDLNQIAPKTTDNNKSKRYDHNNMIQFLSSACNDEFSVTQMEEIFSILTTIPESKLPYGENIDFSRYHYLMQKYAKLNTREEQGKLKNRFKYFIAMIAKDEKDAKNADLR